MIYNKQKNNLEKKEDESNEDLELDNIELEKNKLYLYSEINRESAFKFNKKIKTLDIVLQNLSNEWDFKINIPIKIYINSNGGDLLQALSIIDYIRSCKSPVYSIIDGCAASAATLISIVANKRFIRKHSFMLIHQFSSFLIGTYENMKDEMINNKMFMKVLQNLYLKYTNIPSDYLKNILKHDLWFDSEKCLKYGLVDKILN